MYSLVYACIIAFKCRQKRFFEFVSVLVFFNVVLVKQGLDKIHFVFDYILSFLPFLSF